MRVRVTVEYDERYPFYDVADQGLGNVIEVDEVMLVRWRAAMETFETVQQEMERACERIVAVRTHAKDSTSDAPKHQECPVVDGNVSWEKAVPYRIPGFSYGD